MLDWTLLGEFYSFCILLLLFVRYHWHEKGAAQTAQRMLFVRCLAVAMLSILLNVACVTALEFPGTLPGPLVMALNTLYFVSSILSCSLFAYLLFEAVLEHVYDKHCLRRATIVLVTITGLALALLTVNLFTGVLFSIDSTGTYVRGPLNAVYYMMPVIEGIFLGICYIRNRRSVSDRMLYVIRSILPIILLLSVLQVSFPNVLLNGTLCALVSLIIFIAFRSHTDDHDSLTEVGSHKAFLEELSLRTQSGQGIHLVQLSILNMSDINLRLGHTLGNALLYEVAHYLNHSLPEVMAFRTGSATFTLTLPYENDAAADAHLQTLTDRLRQPWQLGEATCQVTFSLAELRAPTLDGQPGQIAERLEYASTLARQRQTPVRYDRETENRFNWRSNMVQLIQLSIEKQRFEVHYQPVYCCHRDLFCSAEALLRLNDLNGRPVPPDVFIPLAEEAGLIDQLTWLVLDDVCRMLTRSDLPGLEWVSMNLSMQQFLDPRLPSQIAAVLQQHNVAPQRLRVEITERFILHDFQFAQKQLNALHQLGIHIYMDDFGTGYSNLSSILQFPFSFIKLDRSLIAPITENRQAALMVTTLAHLFRDLDKRVVAEGVETADQVACLKDIGVDMIQGFYYARPVPTAQLGQYFAAGAAKQ